MLWLAAASPDSAPWARAANGPPGGRGRGDPPQGTRYWAGSPCWPAWRPLTSDRPPPWGGGPGPRAQKSPYVPGCVRGISYYIGSYFHGLIPYNKPKQAKTLAKPRKKCSAIGLFVLSEPLCTTFSRPFSARVCQTGPEIAPGAPQALS